MTDKEIWKPIDGYEGYYEVSSTGLLRSVDHSVVRAVNGGLRVSTVRGRFIKARIGKNGYKIVTLSREGIRKHFTLHRIVAIAFVPNPYNYNCVNHKDENKLNNKPDNLEWCTHRYNDNYGTKPKKISQSHLRNPPRFREVSQFSENGAFIKTFHSAASAARKTGVDSSWIIACCRGTKHAKTAGGFKWKYADE